MKKLLVLLLALCALSLATGTISARAEDTTAKGKVRGTTTCKKCNKEMGNEKHHCQCSREVCVQPVQALKHAPMKKVCDNKDRCPDNTVARTDKHGNLECIETRAEEIKHKPICDTTCSWACPTGFTEEEMTPGHKMHPETHDNHHEAKKRRATTNGERMSKKAARTAEAA